MAHRFALDPSLTEEDIWAFDNNDPLNRGVGITMTNEHVASLLHWNKLLANCSSDIYISFYYLKRSLIYEDMKLYIECYDNMVMAEIHDPSDEIKIRKANCLEAVRLYSRENQKVYMTLSYPANPRLPFAINSLEMESNPCHGNHLRTTQELKIGDIIAIEDPIFAVTSTNLNSEHFLEVDQCYKRCDHCCKSNNMNLIPCNTCNAAMYCSKLCKETAMKIYHKYECIINWKIPNILHLVRGMRTFFMMLHLYKGDIRAMRSAIEERGSRTRTVFDYNFNDQGDKRYSKNMMAIFDSYVARTNKNQKQNIFERIFQSHPDLAPMWENNGEFIKDLIARHSNNLRELGQVILKWPTNTRSLLEKMPGDFNVAHIRRIAAVGYYPLTGLINHSCIPNVTRHINEHNQMVLIVIRPILSSQQIFIDYTGNFYYCNETRINRVRDLYEHYKFTCRCRACIRTSASNYPLSQNQHIYNYELLLLISEYSKGFKTWTRQEARDKYCDFIRLLSNHYSPTPAQEICYLQYCINEVLALTARPESPL